MSLLCVCVCVCVPELSLHMMRMQHVITMVAGIRDGRTMIVRNRKICSAMPCNKGV